MKKFLLALFCICALFAGPSLSHATISLYVDAAPNAYGSPDFAGWETNAYNAAMNGTFVNMQHSSNPGLSNSTYFTAQDITVYSFGDLGRRLHFVWWIPGETVASLTEKGIQVALTSTYGGTVYDWYTNKPITSTEPMTWGTPGHFENAVNADGESGVVGNSGSAWWGAYGYSADTPEARDALNHDLSDIQAYQGNVEFFIRYGTETHSLTAAPVPLPGALLLLSPGLAGLAVLRRKYIGR